MYFQYEIYSFYDKNIMFIHKNIKKSRNMIKLNSGCVYMILGHNIIASRMLGINNNKISKTTEKLSTGYRIIFRLLNLHY
ncbi:hypothetical protein rsdtw13_27790 [Clostridium sp. TW13]|uniref:Uncharacterized protein n=1 Tax=Inconstantimicrobium mannanitabidum TaxID=1604901 RepID=A0ACB5REH7_9CLOT|nr:hypothetical protein rsdtw13_27790 [Clostridium sp. TW13]